MKSQLWIACRSNLAVMLVLNDLVWGYWMDDFAIRGCQSIFFCGKWVTGINYVDIWFECHVRSQNWWSENMISKRNNGNTRHDWIICLEILELHSNI
jgi:hypothetical protein